MNFRLHTLLGIFIALLIAMNLLGGKIITILGIWVSVWIFMVPLTFLITDIVEDVYGKKLSRQFIIIGMISLTMILWFMILYVYLPPNERYTFNTEYLTIFKLSGRITIASMIAFVLAQLHDIRHFRFIKRKTKGKLLRLRNNTSTMISQAIDTLVFMMIAFYGINDKFTFGFIVSLAIPYYLFKVAFSALDTPLVYAGVKRLKWWVTKDEKTHVHKSKLPNDINPDLI